MLATALVAAAVFAALSAPGLVFRRVVQTRLRVPASVRHREPGNAVTLAIGGTASVAAAWLFAAYRAAWPEHSPDVGRLLRDTSEYIPANLPYLAAWLCLVYGMAVGIAALMGCCATARRFRDKVDRDVSVWWRVFREGVEEPRISRFRKLITRGKAANEGTLPPAVRIELHGGGCVEGELVFHNSNHEDSPNRDVALMKPRYVVEPPACSPLDEPGYLVISASQIRLMAVTHRTVDGGSGESDDSSES